MLATACVSAVGKKDWQNSKSEVILRAIATFGEDPTGKAADEAMSDIVEFASVSEDVTVILDANVIPWFARDPELKHGRTLLVAFMAGNVEAQLRGKVDEDRPADGILFLCKVYASLRKKGLVEAVPEIEKWSRMDRRQLAKLVKDQRSRDQQPAE